MAEANSTVYVGPVNCWKELGMSIVRQAIIDWHDSTKALRTPGNLMPRKAKAYADLRRDAEVFLRSSWCEFYSGLDGETVINKLKSGV